jgi:hypothetical protein
LARSSTGIQVKIGLGSLYILLRIEWLLSLVRSRLASTSPGKWSGISLSILYLYLTNGKTIAVGADTIGWQ